MAIHQWIRIKIDANMNCTVEPSTLIAYRSAGNRNDYVHWVLDCPVEIQFATANGIVMGADWNGATTSRPIPEQAGGDRAGEHFVMGFRHDGGGGEPPDGNYKYTINWVRTSDRAPFSFDPELELDQEA